MSARDNLLKIVQKSGWYLTPEAVDDFLAEKPNLNSNDLIKKVLDSDLRNIGAKSLPDLVASGKADSFDGANCVLQLVKLRNIGAPKDNENSHTAPPMYKITLTDGNSNCNALVLDEINKLNLNTPPGTKLNLIGNIKIKSNLLILNNSNCKNLGGFVEYLVDKWKTNKDLSQHVRAMNMTDLAPPPWVPFGIKQTNQVDTTKKVLAQSETTEDNSSEFSQARKAALAEAIEAKSKVTKTFVEKNVDKSKIEKEIAAAAAAAASTTAANSLTSNTFTLSNSSNKPNKSAGKGGRKGRNKDYDDEDDYKDVKDAAKPSAVTLFDLFKTKLDIKDESPSPVTVSSSSNNLGNNFDNQRGQNSFSRGRGRGGNRGGGRGGRQNAFSNQSNNNVQNNEKKQVYNQNDFAYDLGDQTSVKDLSAIKNFEAKSNKNSNTSGQQHQSTFIQNEQNNNNNNRNNQNNTNNNYNKNNYDNPNYTKNNNNNSQNNYRQSYNSNNRNYNNNNYQQPAPSVYNSQSQFNPNPYQSYPNNDYYAMPPPSSQMTMNQPNQFYNNNNNNNYQQFKPRGGQNFNNQNNSSGNGNNYNNRRQY